MDFLEQFHAARRVSTPLVAIRTFDPKNTTRSISSSFTAEKLAKIPMLIWDAVHGLLPFNQLDTSTKAHAYTLGSKGEEQPEEISQEETRNLHVVLRVLETAPRADSIIFIANAHMQWMNNDPNVIQGIWNLRDIFKGRGVMLVLLTTPGATLPAEITNDVLLLDEPLPTAKQLESVVKGTFKAAVGEKLLAETLTDQIQKQTVDALVGIPAFIAEQTTAMSLTIQKDAGGIITGASIDVPQLLTRKRQQINSAPGLSVYAGKEKLKDIGGNDGAKEFMSAIMTGRQAPRVILFMDEIDKGYAGHGTDSSGTKTEMLGSQLTWHQERNIKGALYFGIPGVSKSLLAKALGNEFDALTINFDIAAMQAGHVGESNANLRTAQKTVEAVAAGEPILAIATCNSVAALPVELLRRFGLATFFFEQPTAEEREIIWGIHRAKWGLTSNESNPEAHGWTGDDIGNCCEKAWTLNWSLAKTANYIVPITKSDSNRITAIRNEANNRYLSAKTGTVYSINELHQEVITPRQGVTAPHFIDEETRKFN